MKALLIVAYLTCADALSVKASAPKQQLRNIFSGCADAVLACPVDRTPLRSDVQVLGSQRRLSKLSESGTKYPVNGEYADLLAGSGVQSGLTLEQLASELRDAWASRTQTQLFSSPVIAFLYERGWRQNFRNAGFPGIDTEYEEVDAFFGDDSSVVVDMSCGSGLMARRLLTGGRFDRLFAMDYSEVMLRETRRRAVEEKLPLDQLELCRVDVAQLPIQTDSVDAMHAGAALHSWPQLELGLAEISRVLKPGGKFFATTFLQGAYGVRFAGESGGGGSFRFFESEQELEDLLVEGGFPREGIEVRREGRGCAIIKAVMGQATEGKATDEEATEAEATEGEATEEETTEGEATEGEATEGEATEEELVAGKPVEVEPTSTEAM